MPQISLGLPRGICRQTTAQPGSPGAAPLGVVDTAPQRCTAPLTRRQRKGTADAATLAQQRSELAQRLQRAPWHTAAAKEPWRSAADAATLAQPHWPSSLAQHSWTKTGKCGIASTAPLLQQHWHDSAGGVNLAQRSCNSMLARPSRRSALALLWRRQDGAAPALESAGPTPLDQDAGAAPILPERWRGAAGAARWHSAREVGPGTALLMEQRWRSHIGSAPWHGAAAPALARLSGAAH